MRVEFASVVWLFAAAVWLWKIAHNPRRYTGEAWAHYDKRGRLLGYAGRPMGYRRVEWIERHTDVVDPETMTYRNDGKRVPLL